MGPIWLFDVPKLFMPEGENPLPFEPGALPEIGYWHPDPNRRKQNTGLGHNQAGRRGADKDGLWPKRAKPVRQVLDPRLQHPAAAYLGLGEGLKEVEKKITEDLTAAKYTPSSIKFDLEATLRYTIVNEDDRGKPRPALVFWNVVLVLWTSAKKAAKCTS